MKNDEGDKRGKAKRLVLSQEVENTTTTTTTTSYLIPSINEGEFT